MSVYYIAVSNDQPIPCGANSDYMKVMNAAQEWADYSRRRVSVIKVTDGWMADLDSIILPQDKHNAH